MNTINQFASITNNMAQISGSIGDLAYQFKEVAPVSYTHLTLPTN